MATKFYLGTDQSLVNTGWAIVAHNNRAKTLEIVEWGTIETCSRHYLYSRLAVIEKGLTEVADRYPLTRLYTEEVYLNRAQAKSSRADDLIRVETIVHLWSQKRNLPTVVMAAATHKANCWRSPLNLNPIKDAAKGHFSKLLNTALGEHEAEAIGIVLGGLNWSEELRLEDFPRYLA